jgi:hypothetical protein
MALPLRPEDLYHTGLVVSDLETAKQRLSAMAGYRWTRPLTYTLPFRTAAGTCELTSTIVYSVQSPHVELVREVPGSPWTALPGHAAHHLGYFTDNLTETGKMLEREGFRFEMTAAVAGSELAMFAYYVDEFGTRIEIVDRAVLPDFPAFLQSMADPSEG